MTAIRIVGRTLLPSILLLCLCSAHAQDVRIAVVGSMTGSFAGAGDQVKRGAELAAKDINEAGGVNGRKIVLSIEDDACDPKQAVSVANHVVGEQITLVDGHVCSGGCIPASAVYAEYSVVMMTPALCQFKTYGQRLRQGLANNHEALCARRQPGQDAGGMDRGQVQGQEDRVCA